MAAYETTARHFQRNYGDVRRRALERPVVITNHGRRDLVVLSAEAFDRLDAPTAMRAESLGTDELAAFTGAFAGYGGARGVDGPAARRLTGVASDDDEVV